MKIRLAELTWFCNSTMEEVAARLGAGMVVDKTRKYAFKDNGASVLAVAHMDTVVEAGKKYGGVVNLDCGPVFFNPYLDDRLGAYIIGSMLPKDYGIKLDLLLTDGEEKGQSTAEDFESDKKYNWIVSFDRAGDDVVLYEYGKQWWGKKGNGDEWEETVKVAGFKIGRGSFSDICRLQHLGCKALNIGTGVENGHSARAYSELEVMASNVRLFREFYDAFHDTHFPHEKRVSTFETSQIGLFRGGMYGDSGYEYYSRQGYGENGCSPGKLTKKERRALKKRLAEWHNVRWCPRCFSYKSHDFFRARESMWCIKCEVEVQDNNTRRGAGAQTVKTPLLASPVPLCPLCRHAMIDGKCVICGHINQTTRFCWTCKTMVGVDKDNKCLKCGGFAQ